MHTHPTPPHIEPPMLVTVPEALRLLGIGRTKFYALLRDGSIPAVKAGRRTLIPHRELHRWAERLPPVNKCAHP